MNLKEFQGLGMNLNSDKFILPEHYTNVVSEPFYSGDGQHSVRALQEICKQYKEYCHQQALIKQKLIEAVKGQEFKWEKLQFDDY